MMPRKMLIVRKRQMGMLVASDQERLMLVERKLRSGMWSFDDFQQELHDAVRTQEHSRGSRNEWFDGIRV